MSEMIKDSNNKTVVMKGKNNSNVREKDPNVWTKTPKEKKALRKLRKQKFHSFSGHVPESKSIPVFSKLYIYIKGSNTVEIRECWWNDIQRVLSIFDNVVKYKWLNKYYSPEETPIWRWK